MCHKVNKLRKIKFLTAVLIFSFVVSEISCGDKISTQRAFYYWKSAFTLSGCEQQVIKDLGVTRLYVKFFDVVWNHELNVPSPVAKITFDSKSLAWAKNRSIEIIPTVFITNEVLQKISDDLLLTHLTPNIAALITNVLADKKIYGVSEIQFDCDWTNS